MRPRWRWLAWAWARAPTGASAGGGAGEAMSGRFAPQAKFSPREHLQWVVRLWRRMDRDENGFISKRELDCEEFRSVLRKIVAPSTGNCMGGPQYARAQMNMDQAVSFFMRKADLNGDGAISFKEFRSFMAALRKSHGALESAEMIFALFDTNTDGNIDEKEFREVFRFFLGHDPTEREFQEEWGRLDAQGRGQVTREEYVFWLQASQNPVFRWHSPDVVSRRGSMLSRRASADGGASSCDDLDLQRGVGSWRPWDNYPQFCWKDPTRGKPSHVRMKFRDTRAVRRTGPTAKVDAAGALDRPDWNPHLAGTHPNMPDKHGKARTPMGSRIFFSRPQSLPALQRHLESQSGLSDLRQAMFSSVQKPRKRAALSHEEDGGAAQVLTSGARGRPGGSMRHPLTRARVRWDDHWHTPPQLKDLRHPPPSTSIGPPARHLFADEYEDEPGGVA